MRARRHDVVTVILVGLLALVPVLAMFGVLDMRDPAAPVDTDVSTVPPTVFTNAPAMVPLSSTTPATVAAPAARGAAVQLTEPPPAPFDPVAYVNDLAARGYCWQCPAPALDAYRVVAANVCNYHPAVACWPAADIEARAQFVERIMAGESAFCWNARAWSHHTALLMPCGQIGQGSRDDAGFGQITHVLRPLTCAKADICSIADTIAAPWPSMVAFVLVLGEQGSRPWCYRDRYGRPNRHMVDGDCATWPG